MKRRHYTQTKVNQSDRVHCARCGKLLRDTGRSNRGWSLDSLLPSRARSEAVLCTDCRLRSVDRRVGAVVSAWT